MAEPVDDTRDGGPGTVQSSRLDWQSHLGLVVAGLIVAFATLRLVRVSNSSAETALALLSLSDTTTVVTGILMQVFPTLLVGLTLGFIIGGFETGRRPPPVVGVAMLLCVFISPWAVLLVGSLLALLDWWMNGRRVVQARSEGGQAVTADRWLVYTGLLVVLLVFPDTVWLPAEQVLTDDSNLYVGFVVDETADDVVFLDDADRTVTRIAKASVADRRFCELSESEWQWTASFVTLLTPGGQPSYPSCDDAFTP